MGIRPNTAFLADSGLEMFKGTLAVDEHLQTNDPDIYAVGDCAFTCNRQTGKKAWSPLGSSANMEGRVAARVISGDDVSYTDVYKRQALDGMPIIYPAGTEDDFGFDHILESRDMLTAAGAEVEMAIVGGGHHLDAWVDVIDDIFRFFEKHA